MRVNPNTGLGFGGEFTPPGWLVSRWGAAATAGRVLADVVGIEPLPPGVSSIHVPRIAVGAVAGPQQQGAPVVEVDETSFDASSPVVTVAGMVDISMQLLEQSPQTISFDQVAFVDLSKNYNRQLEAQLFFGSGANDQLLGLTGITGRNADVSGAGITTVAPFYSALGQIAAAVGNNRLLPATHFFTAPRRWAWIASSLDGSGRPLTTPSYNPSTNTPGLPYAGGTNAVGSWLGKPVYEAGAIPAGTSADLVCACRPSDFLLFEGPAEIDVKQIVLAGTLQARVIFHRYVAWIPHRRPASISLLVNLPQPTTFRGATMLDLAARKAAMLQARAARDAFRAQQSRASRKADAVAFRAGEANVEVRAGREVRPSTGPGRCCPQGS